MADKDKEKDKKAGPEKDAKAPPREPKKPRPEKKGGEGKAKAVESDVPKAAKPQVSGPTPPRLQVR